MPAPKAGDVVAGKETSDIGARKLLLAKLVYMVRLKLNHIEICNNDV